MERAIHFPLSRALEQLPGKLKDGYSTALTGERPFKMERQSITSLNEATEGKKIENVGRGIDVVEASNVDELIKK